MRFFWGCHGSNVVRMYCREIFFLYPWTSDLTLHYYVRDKASLMCRYLEVKKSNSRYKKTLKKELTTPLRLL